MVLSLLHPSLTRQKVYNMLNHALKIEHKSFLRSMLLDIKSSLPRRHYDELYKFVNGATYGSLFEQFALHQQHLVDGTLPDTFLGIPQDCGWNIRFTRQLLGAFTKLNCAINPTADIAAWVSRVSTSRARLFSRDDIEYCRKIVSRLLGTCPSVGDIKPSHGPGAVSTGEKPHQKWRFRRWYNGLSAIKNAYSLFYANDNHLILEPHSFNTERYGVTKVIAVPKDMRTTRIISAEPLELQYVQQAYCRVMMRRLANNSRGMIQFEDQKLNQLHSRLLSNATLDMSAASDTISRIIVKQLLPPDWYSALHACRSTFSKVGDRLVPLRCFSPMGSAVCFPLESVIFYAVCYCALRRAGCKASEISSSLRIYGDDIIVPVQYAEYVIEYLSECGFLPNRKKCSYKGLFRESCGAEWYDAFCVRPIRFRSFDYHGIDAVPMVRHQALLRERGFCNAADHILRNLKIPYYVDRDTHNCKFRYNKKLFRTEAYVAVSKPYMVSCRTSYSSYSFLLSYFLKNSSSSEVLRPRFNQLQRKWLPTNFGSLLDLEVASATR